MSTSEKILVDINSLTPGSVIEMFVIDGSSIGMDAPIHFHAGTNGLMQNLVWQGVEYVRYPVDASGFEISAQGQIPRPKLKVSNYLSAMTALILQFGDLIGAKVIRKRTLKKYLDAVNFSDSVNPSADPEAYLADDVFYIDRKAVENRELIEFELSSSMDLAGVRLPRRQIVQNLCPWKYRGGECGYTGENYFKADDSSTTNQSEDVCGKRLSSCKARFGETQELPFGGFPGSGLYR